MFIPRVYYPHDLCVGNIIELDKEASHYLTTVLRLKNNESVILFNGQGGEFSGECQILKKHVQVHIVAFHDVKRQSNLSLHLGQALARGDRMDFVIQKATELGVMSITPLLTARCTVKVDEARSVKRMTHWQKIAISASEQCGRTEIPVIHAPISLKEWLAQSFEGLSVVFDMLAPIAVKDLNLKTAAIRLAIGPESGWHENEIQAMISQEFTTCRLGPRVLRTETAAIAAVSLLQGLFGDL